MQILILSRDNAGRSQMAYGFFLRELTKRKLGDIEVTAAGTDPADRIDPDARKAMQAVSIDLMGAVPTEVTEDDLQEADHVITLGLQLEDVAVEGFDAEQTVWTIASIEEMSLSDVEDVRDRIEQKVEAFLDEHA
jgi:arsenate reductase